MTVEMAIVISIGILTLAYAAAGIDYDIKWIIHQYKRRKRK